MNDELLASTRLSLHAVAELVLAGPQYAAAGRIALRVTPGGFSTVEGPPVRVEDGAVVAGAGRQRIDGHTSRELAALLGLDARRLDDVYAGGPGVDPAAVLAVDPDRARLVTDALATGDAALRSLAGGAEPVLWPEHFDVAVTLDEVNYGVSPGDGHIAEPYAYVGPWAVPDTDGFWNAPFGASRRVAELGSPEAVLAFFEEGRRRAG
jgi:hypothetical protein